MYKCYIHCITTIGELITHENFKETPNQKCTILVSCWFDTLVKIFTWCKKQTCTLYRRGDTDKSNSAYQLNLAVN